MDKPKSRSEAVEDPKEEERVETPIASRAKKTIYILINIFKKFQNEFCLSDFRLLPKWRLLNSFDS